MASSQGSRPVKVNYILIFTAERINNLLKHKSHIAKRLNVFIIYPKFIFIQPKGLSLFKNDFRVNYLQNNAMTESCFKT